MNILQIISNFEWAYGGPVTTVYGLSNELAKRGHQVHIYTTNMGKKGFLSENQKIKAPQKNVKVYYFKCVNNWVANKFSLSISPEMWLAIRKNLRNFDIVHSQEFRGLHNSYLEHYATKYKIPYVLQAHGASSQYYYGQSKLFILGKIIFDNLFNKKIINNASSIVALTDIEVEQYKRFNIAENKISILPNGINLSEYSSLPNFGDFKARYNIADNEKLILYLGQIHQIKGIDILLAAFANLLDDTDNIKLGIVGPDSGFLSNVKNQIKELKIKDKVIITGPIYGKDKLKAYIDADVYVLPSKYETFPNTVLEACACGTPIIITDKCGISNIIKSNEAGIVIKNNSMELQNAILQLLNDEKLRSAVSTNAQKLVFENYNWEKISLDFENLYKVLKYEKYR